MNSGDLTKVLQLLETGCVNLDNIVLSLLEFL